MPLSGIPKANPPRIRIKGVKRTLRKLASKALESPGLRQVNKAARLNPVLFAGASIGLRYLLGDGLVQKMEGGSWDVRRSVIFGLFGFAYGSTVGYGVYNILYPRFAPPGWPLGTAIFDVLTNTPFIYFPMYYFVYVAIDDNMMHGPAEYIKRGLKLHRENFREDAKAAAMFWIPVHWLNFKMVPLHLRMPFMGLIGFSWAVILSAQRGMRSNADTNIALEQAQEEHMQIKEGVAKANKEVISNNALVAGTKAVK
uniref:Uncharacterized protein n=2 Tax=Lotharella globosa TaxID=91324 RepID=A0A7S3YJ58_9EUKA|mmetsp:Transcript_5437/g.10652  ORF Transcript_5437/g.10652 Transcript_5437/m.10652 type:complete len:255 (+) Transcript_5437:228-992(+)|eukprot:CAMPEP_0167787404 /NCGR_PEP_ID=MMETSP0111_2-20121227/9401_1 /TAXON_ID=91324 /ORGANISM="Lotharella globosa, Strain CCCM811" /LENGTH=254 /DNA_ID=CAMNT_0007679037 /DNA_START=67 /DNA_END=831 /DNA_ORIENTATION=-